MEKPEIIESKRLADDDIYLNEDRYDTPKELFKFIASKIEPNIGSDKLEILDVGCATGELIYYLKKRFPSVKCTGIDISEHMIKAAKEKMPDQTFLCEEILTEFSEPNKKYDIVVCVGVLQIFDDLETPIKSLLSRVKEKGSLYISTIFNIHPVDVITRYRSVLPENSEWQLGWNTYSTQTYDRILKDSDYELQWKWHDFSMPFDIKKTHDPMRTWTIKTESNPFQLVNGNSQMINIKLLEINFE